MGLSSEEGNQRICPSATSNWLTAAGHGAGTASRQREQSRCDIEFGINTPIPRQRDDDNQGAISVAIESVDIPDSLFQLFLACDRQDGVGVFLTDVRNREPAPRGYADSSVAEADGRLTQDIDGTIGTTAGALKPGVVVFGFAPIAAPEAVRQEEDSTTRWNSCQPGYVIFSQMKSPCHDIGLKPE
jgi:hypothetical protein